MDPIISKLSGFPTVHDFHFLVYEKKDLCTYMWISSIQRKFVSHGNSFIVLFCGILKTHKLLLWLKIDENMAIFYFEWLNPNLKTVFFSRRASLGQQPPHPINVSGKQIRASSWIFSHFSRNLMLNIAGICYNTNFPSSIY